MARPNKKQTEYTARFPEVYASVHDALPSIEAGVRNAIAAIADAGDAASPRVELYSAHDFLRVQVVGTSKMAKAYDLPYGPNGWHDGFEFVAQFMLTETLGPSIPVLCPLPG